MELPGALVPVKVTLPFANVAWVIAGTRPVVVAILLTQCLWLMAGQLDENCRCVIGAGGTKCCANRIPFLPMNCACYAGAKESALDGAIRKSAPADWADAKRFRGN